MAHKPPTRVSEELRYSINQLQGARGVAKHARKTLMNVQTQTHTGFYVTLTNTQKVQYKASDVCDVRHNWANISHSTASLLLL